MNSPLIDLMVISMLDFNIYEVAYIITKYCIVIKQIIDLFFCDKSILSNELLTLLLIFIDMPS